MKALHPLLPALFLWALPLQAQFQHIWHEPATTTSVPDGVSMRNPLYPAATVSTTVYQGVWKGEGANQTGGTLKYRTGGGAWQSVGLGFHANSGDNQFWKAEISTPAVAGTTVEYYVHVTFDNRTNTYLSRNNTKTLDEAAAQANPYSFPAAVVTSTGKLNADGVNSNYNKLNFYIDEIRDSAFPEIFLQFIPDEPGLAEVEIFSNLNNRARANQDWNNDGIEDGILPPDGALITAAHTDVYFQAHTMTHVGGGVYTLRLPVNKTGAYRLTGRYKKSGNPSWNWLRDQGVRDLAVVVAPTIARDMSIYELHVSNANASGPTFAQRGTFEDLHDPTKRVQLDWLTHLGLNWIWFQPFHPLAIEGRENDPATGSAYDPGSPYAIRNFWEINTLYTRNYNPGLSNPVSHPDNYAAAMTAFQNFAAAADTAGVQLMLDFPFNHTAPDVQLGQKGVQIFAPSGNPGGWQPGDLIRDRVPQFFSTDGGEGPAAYSAPAQSAARIAVAPDRNDFGKWNDVRDVFFGTYSTLVTGYPDADSSRQTVRNEDDLMNYTSMGDPTVKVWRYFGEVLPYWLQRSGHRGYNSTPADGSAAAREALDLAGIDGLRKDFGQGLPPQAMEYLINRTQSVKWNFVFMSESLDGGQVTYRSSRHFTVLNENIVFPFQAATTTPAYRQVFEDRRGAYGQSLVLLNNTSHDEAPYADPWEALIRYATASSNDGAPMIMYGQEIGAGQRFQDPLPQGAFDYYELNFGKYIPHFKKWNSMQPQWTAWDANSLGTQFLRPVYAGIGQARRFSPALRSSNRWFLNRQSDGQPNPQIFAVAKWTQSGVPPAHQDVVLAFTNLDRASARADTFAIPGALADTLGLASGRSYNVRNIAAYLGRNNEHPWRRDAFLWPADRSGAEIMAQGVYAGLNPVPATDVAWATAPYEAQFLKLYDVTPPPSPPPNAPYYAIGSSATFTWIPNAGPHDNLRGHLVVVRDADGTQVALSLVENGGTAFTFNGTPGEVYYATITAVSTAGVSSTQPQGSDPGAPNPASATTPVILLDPNGDHDLDGMLNWQEDFAGTNPLEDGSLLRVTAMEHTPTHARVTCTTVPGRSYQVYATASLTTPDWQPRGLAVVATGPTLLFEIPRAPGDDYLAYRVRVLDVP